MTASYQYVEQVRRELACTPLHQERFIRDLKSLVEDFAADNPTAALSDFRREFGMPEELAQQYMSTLDDREVRKYRRRRKMCRVVPLVVMGILIAGMSVALCAKYTRVFEPPATAETTLLIAPGWPMDSIKEITRELEKEIGH